MRSAGRFTARGQAVGLRAVALLVAAGLAGTLLATGASGSDGAASASDPAQRTAVNLSRSAAPSVGPAVAVGPAGAMVVWEEEEALWFALRRGGVWSAPAPVPSAVGGQAALAAGPDGAFELVWSGFSALDENLEVYHSRWRAEAWSLPVNLSASAGESLEPDIAVRTDGMRFVVWSETQDGTVLYGATAPAGGGWSSGPIPDAEGEMPAVAAEDDAWHLAWSEPLVPGETNGILYFARRGGAGWGLPEAVSDVGPPAAEWPDLAVGADRGPAIAWLAGDREVRFSARDGAGWPEAVTLDTDAAGLGAPAIAAGAGGRWHVVWAHGPEVRLASPEVFVGGGRVMRFARQARGAALAADGDGLLVVAEGREATDEGDIYALAVAPAGIPDTPTPTVAASPTREATPGATPTDVGSPTPGPSPAEPTPTTSPATPTGTRPVVGRIHLPAGFKGGVAGP